MGRSASAPLARSARRGRLALRAVDHPSVSTSGPRMRAPGYEPPASPVWPPFTGPTHPLGHTLLDQPLLISDPGQSRRPADHIETRAEEIRHRRVPPGQVEHPRRAVQRERGHIAHVNRLNPPSRLTRRQNPATSPHPLQPPRQPPHVLTRPQNHPQAAGPSSGTARTPRSPPAPHQPW